MGSPCEKLEFTDDAKSIGRCTIYSKRFGVHQTVAGQSFRCVPMTTKLLTDGVPHPNCGYNVVRSIEGVPVVRGLP